MVAVGGSCVDSVCTNLMMFTCHSLGNGSLWQRSAVLRNYIQESQCFVIIPCYGP